MAEILEAVASLIGVLVWPLVVLSGLLLYRKPLLSLLNRAKQMSLSFLGHEITIEGDSVAPEVKDLLLEVQETVSGLTQEHRNLFEQIRASDGRRSVESLIPGFSRGSDHHRILQELRDRKLIRPFEGDSWQAGKHPVVTRFAQLILRINPSILETRKDA